LSVSPSRDPRGKLTVSGDAVTAFLSGGTCNGTWSSAVELTCTVEAGEFALDGEQFHFLAGQNTMENAGDEKVYSASRTGEFRLIASADGKTRATRGQQSFSLAGWGSDIASFPTRCAANPVAAASSASAAESLTAYEILAPSPRSL